MLSCEGDFDYADSKTFYKQSVTMLHLVGSFSLRNVERSVIEKSVEIVIVLRLFFNMAYISVVIRFLPKAYF